MFLFKKKPRSHLGIDIGASAVKLVELEKEEGRNKLKNYGIFPLREYLQPTGRQAHSESSKIPNEEIAKIIKKTIKEAKITSRETYLSVPVYSSFSTLVDFPAMSEKEIATAIPFEARKYVPVPISEVVLDWSIVSPPNKQAGRQVLLIAVPKEIISDYNQIVRLAGLNLRGIEEETFSLSRALIGNDKSTVILVDVGARSVNVSIVDGGYIRITHNLEMGGIKLTKAISQQMGLSLEKAEELKKSLSANQLTNEQNSQLKGVIHSVLDIVIFEIKKIIDSYQSKYNRKVEKCILVGGGVQVIGFVDYFISKLGLEVSLGNPFARVIYPSLLESTLKELGPCLAVAVGLAMRDS
jgi:type IV pilus assembly protein PilM